MYYGLETIWLLLTTVLDQALFPVMLRGIMWYWGLKLAGIWYWGLKLKLKLKLTLHPKNLFYYFGR